MALAPLVLNGWQTNSQPACPTTRTMSDIPTILSTFWMTPSGVLGGGALTLVVVCALIGTMTIGGPEDPTDL